MVLLAFLLGTIFASFINLYVLRFLRGESIIFPRSHCDNCNHTLNWYELIPIVSYLALKGKCKCCKQKIGITSLIAELFLGFAFSLVYMIYGYSINTLIGFLLASTLLAISISDFKEMIILDSTLITSTILSYILIYLEFGLRGIYKSFLYGVFGFVLFFLVKLIGDKVYKRESLGGGDVKLAFLMGSILPYNLFLIAIIIGSLVALPYALIMSLYKKKELPFGPFLALGLFIVFLFKNGIANFVNTILIIEKIFL